MTRSGIVIPTRARRSELLELVETILADEALGPATIAVVCNGENPDPKVIDMLDALQQGITADAARTLEVVHIDAPSKPRALNRGDQVIGARDVSLYVDDDVRITSGQLSSVRDRLIELGDSAALVAPRRVVEPSCGWKERLFGSCVLRPSWVRSDVCVGGIFGVNRAGRERWGSFPAIACDDAYVFSRFAPEERLVEDGCSATHPYPSTWRGIFDQQVRWRLAIQELREQGLIGPHRASIRTPGMVARAALDPRLLMGMCLVATVRMSSRVLGRSSLSPGGVWD